jgi:hypothetical protein
MEKLLHHWTGVGLDRYANIPHQSDTTGEGNKEWLIKEFSF